MIIDTLAYVVDQVDERTFQARLWETDSIVTCYLSHELFYRNIQPSVGDLVQLEYNSGLRDAKRRVQKIVAILYSKKKQDKFKKVAMPITRGLSTLKGLNRDYDFFTITSQFGIKLGQLLYSTLGLRTLQDLVNVEAFTLVRVVCEFCNKIDLERFYENFEDLVEFFERDNSPK